MAVIKKNDLKVMSAKEAEAKIADLERTILELHGEGKREKVRPLKRTIAKLKTIIANPSAEKPKEETPKKEEKKPEEKPKEKV